MPASNWRLSASSLGLMSDPADPTPHPITPLSTADSSRTTNWEQQFFDDDAVYRPSTTTSIIGNGGGGYGVQCAAGQIGGGSQQIVSPTRLQLEFSPLRI
uniref:Uncharacterized protein n=1 Tax=Plectus sambesii TaxID=2011161 RepID=A0A914WLS8_9BILA